MAGLLALAAVLAHPRPDLPEPATVFSPSEPSRVESLVAPITAGYHLSRDNKLEVDGLAPGSFYPARCDVLSTADGGTMFVRDDRVERLSGSSLSVNGSVLLSVGDSRDTVLAF